MNLAISQPSRPAVEVAHNLAPLYGLVSVLLALAAGWAAGVIFRRV